MKKITGLLIGIAILLLNIAIAENKMDTKKIINMDPAQLDKAEMFAVEDYPFMKLVEGEDPKAGAVTNFVSADGKLDIGFSRYSKITLQLSDWPVDEFMYFLEGQVEITDEDGSAKIYGPGDAIVMPKGFNGTWRQLSPIKKINISYPMDDTSFE
jgi:uncharacterized protein